VRSDAPAEDVYALRLVRGLVAARGGPRRPPATLRRVLLRAARPSAVPAGGIADQGYTLEVETDRVVITGTTRAARLHGVETLRQLWLLGGGGVPTTRIVDAPSLRVRGLSLDVSRGRSPTLSDLVATLDLCAAFKLNVFQLYFEDTFDYSGVPAGARAADTFDPLTLRRVAAEARLRAIEFIPIVQTLAHQERMLSRPEMMRHAERRGSSMFAVTAPATRVLIRTMLDDVLAASGSRAVHLGCDEAADLGVGESAALVRRLGGGVEAVFREHVVDLAQHARTQWNARSWIYADQLRAHPTLAASLPRDLVLVDWDYDPASAFASLDTLAAAGLDRVVTSPGLWDWCAVYPDQPRARGNIEAATRAARAHGALGSVLASWGDHGGECLFGNDVLGLAWFAESAWRNTPGDAAAFLPRYCRLRFGTSAGAVATALQALDALALPTDGTNERMLYRPILLRRRTRVWRGAMAGIAGRLEPARAALAAARGNDVAADTELEALRAATGRLLAAADRERTLDALAEAIEAVPAGDPAAQDHAAAELSRVRAAEAAAQAAYVEAWRARNRESGLVTLRARFAGQLATLDSLRACAERRELRVYSAASRVLANQ
jgi:hypothetical protein